MTPAFGDVMIFFGSLALALSLRDINLLTPDTFVHFTPLFFLEERGAVERRAAR